MSNIIKFMGIAMTVLFISSCRLTTFTAQPGSPRNTFPKEMHGLYMAVNKSNGENDTTFLKIDENITESNNIMLAKLLDLSDSSTLTHLGDYYFFNIRHIDNEKFIWWTFPVLVKKNALYVFSLTKGKQERKLGKYLKTDGNVKGQYIMDNEPFKRYCERHLKKRKALKLKRLK